MIKKIFILTITLILLAIIQPSIKSFAEERYVELQNFSKVLNLIQQSYVDNVDTKKLVYGAIKGMLRELDPHTTFMTPDMFKDFESETQGEFGGLGIEITIQNGILIIISPIEDAPAWHAGVKAGDKVIQIDSHSTKGITLAEASQYLRGKKGSKVVLKIVRDGLEDPIDIPIVRGNVKVKSVKYTDIEDGYAYVRLTNFIENTAQDLQAVLDKHLSKHKKIEGLLIDLRRNPGGLLDQAVKVSDLFIKEGVIVSTIGRDRSKKEVVNASKKAKFSDVPVVVLLNEFSASASEIVAGAFQDNKRALIVGTRSFGKGSVQSVIRLNDGSGMKMTIARYYTPSGISIQAEGIKPDIEIEDVDSENFSKLINKSKGQREKDIIGHLRGDREGDTDEDSQSSKEAKKKSIGDESGTMAWWKSVTSKDEKQLNDKEKLFRKDYQAYQAFGYLKAISKNPQR